MKWGSCEISCSPPPYGVHSLPKLHSSTYYPIMRYWYCILLHAWHILLLNIPLCNIHIAFCYMNVTFGYMPFVNLIFYYAILMLYFAKWIVAHGCIMRHCIMRYESFIRRDVFCSVVFRFMNEQGRLLVRHLMDKCFYQSAQSASLLWVTIQLLYIFYEFKHTSNAMVT